MTTTHISQPIALSEHLLALFLYAYPHRNHVCHVIPSEPILFIANALFYREVLLGITGKDFVILAASKATMRGPTIIKAEDDKTRELNNHTLMAFSGEAGDTGQYWAVGELKVDVNRVLISLFQIVQFAEYIQANIQLYTKRNDTELSTPAVANFIRGELARSLRSRSPYTVNLLLGGVEPETAAPHLYWIDYLASLAPVPYAAHGYAQYV